MLELIYQLYAYELKLSLFVYIERFFQRQVDYIERKLEFIRHLIYIEKVTQISFDAYIDKINDLKIVAFRDFKINEEVEVKQRQPGVIPCYHKSIFYCGVLEFLQTSLVLIKQSRFLLPNFESGLDNIYNTLLRYINIIDYESIGFSALLQKEFSLIRYADEIYENVYSRSHLLNMITNIDHRGCYNELMETINDKREAFVMIYIEKTQELQSLFENAGLEFSQASILNYIHNSNDIRCIKIHDFLNDSAEIKDVAKEHKANSCVAGIDRR
jgi:hypothetical protein